MNTKITKKLFSLRTPIIKFIGRRKHPKHHESHHHKEAESIKNDTLSKLDKEVKTGNSVPQIFLLKENNSYKRFIDFYNKIESDLDIERDHPSEEEIKAVNYCEVKVNDWKNIKL